MKFKLLFILFFTSLPFAFGKKVLYAECQMGSGCKFTISDATTNEIEIILGDGYNLQNLHEDDILVQTRKNGQDIWYIEKDMTRSELDRFYGGDGYTMIYPFDPNFQPMDGKWKIQFGTVSAPPCYGQVNNILKSLTGQIQSGQVIFPKPFHPKALMPSSYFKWIKIGANKYRGTFGKSNMNVVLSVELVGKGKIVGTYVVTIKIPTKPDCISTIPLTMICLEPNEGIDPWEGWTSNPIDPYANGPDTPIDLGLGDENPKPNVPMIEDPPYTDVPSLEDNPKPNVPRLEDNPKPNVPRVDDY